MAGNPIGREVQPVTLPGMIPPMPAVARILARYDRGKVEAFIEVAIGLLDTLDGDPEAEDCTDVEDDFALSSQARWWGPRQESDSEAGAYAEWHTLPASSRKAGQCMVNACGNEDDEEDDAPEEDDHSGMIDEDGVNTCVPGMHWAGAMIPFGPGCPLSDGD